MEWKFARLRPQFRLQSLLWVMVLIAVAITAYKSGYRTGFVRGENHRRSVGESYAKAYHIADLVSFNPATTSDLLYADDLVRDLCQKVLPRTWQEQGGKASISGYAKNGMIVVSHDQDGHDRIADYLEQRRQRGMTVKD